VQRKAQKRGVKSVKCTVKERESERVVRHTTVTAMTESAKGVVIEGRRVEKTRCVSTCVCVQGDIPTMRHRAEHTYMYISAALLPCAGAHFKKSTLPVHPAK
jgi:hypothetical protein